MSVRLEDIEQAESVIVNLRETYLREHGWDYVCNTPDCCWHWSTKLPDGRTVLLSQSSALDMEEALCPHPVPKRESRLAPLTGSPLPTDDSQKSIKTRMDAVYNGQEPRMPRLASMTKKQMAKELQSIWTLCDETGVHRRNETAPRVHLSLYGRVLRAIQNGANEKVELRSQCPLAPTPGSAERKL